MEKPQIICHIEKSLPFTLYDALWIPSSAKFIILGSQPRGSGVFQIYEINESEACVIKNVSILKGKICLDSNNQPTRPTKY